MLKDKPKKGKIFIQTSKGIFPQSVLAKAEKVRIQKDSSQLPEKELWGTLNNLVIPPYSPNAFLVLYESNSVFWRCVNQLAIDVAGLGWFLELKEGKQEDDKEKLRIETFLNKPNPKENLRAILKKLLIDWGSIGCFALEVVTNTMGQPIEVYHLPGHTLRVHIKKEKYCQLRNNKKVWFKDIDSEINISAKTGEDSGFTLKTKANSLIYYKNFYPKSDYYGAPNILSAVGDVVGLIGLRDYNLSFFENYGVPAAIIILEGDWETGSDDKIANFLNTELKGTENSNKTMVVSQPDNCKFTYHKLGVEVKEGSFRLYEQGRTDKILMAYSMPPERIGVKTVGPLGGNVVEDTTRIYVQSVVNPLQIDIEEIINTKLLKSEIYEFQFEAIDLRDYAADVTRMVAMVDRAMLTPNQARVELGYKAYPGGDKYYISSDLIEVGEDNEPLAQDEENNEEKET